MSDKKAKQTKPVVLSKKEGWGSRLGKFMIIVILIAINIVLWSLIAYEAKMMREKAEYEKRQKEQIVLERTRQKELAMANAVAIVDGEPISMDQVRELVDATPQLAELPFETVYPNVLDMMINNRVIMLGAAKAGVPDRPEIRRMLRQAEEQIIGQTYLDELLTAQVSEDELRALYDQEAT